MNCVIDVVSYRNSTSNHNTRRTTTWTCVVVSYRNSTSNHNMNARRQWRFQVVSYRNSTSNHNVRKMWRLPASVVSYRNSTSNHNVRKVRRLPASLYLIEILHQTTTSEALLLLLARCILSKFYIKPQQCFIQHHSRCVVSYRNSTSNHNNFSPLSKSEDVVSYRNSTSNHNEANNALFHVLLYLIEILHQTTTWSIC